MLDNNLVKELDKVAERLEHAKKKANLWLAAVFIATTVGGVASSISSTYNKDNFLKNRLNKAGYKKVDLLQIPKSTLCQDALPNVKNMVSREFTSVSGKYVCWDKDTNEVFVVTSKGYSVKKLGSGK